MAKRGPPYREIDWDRMREIIKENPGISKRKLAKLMGIPRPTLQRRLKQEFGGELP